MWGWPGRPVAAAAADSAAAAVAAAHVPAEPAPGEPVHTATKPVIIDRLIQGQG